MPEWFLHAWHLLWQSIKDIPGAVGSSTILGAVLPFFIVVSGEVVGIIVLGRATMKAKAREALLIGLASLGALYFGIFLYVIARNIYTDHIRLRDEKISLRQQLEFRQTHGLSLRIGGVNFSTNQRGITTAIVTLRAFNDGTPTLAHGWNMHVSLGGNIINGDHVSSISDNREHLDEHLEQPLATNAETTGEVSFVLGRHGSIGDQLLSDQSATVFVSTLDNNNREITTERKVADLAGEQTIHEDNRPQIGFEQFSLPPNVGMGKPELVKTPGVEAIITARTVVPVIYLEAACDRPCIFASYGGVDSSALATVTLVEGSDHLYRARFAMPSVLNIGKQVTLDFRSKDERAIKLQYVHLLPIHETSRQ